ncbi:MAG: SagB/ThcOx family dehydrogenase [Oxalobacter sp.]|nr:MAG: SagB/ThcOx family dehydrogenase [Oxalobacter sp.]
MGCLFGLLLLAGCKGESSKPAKSAAAAVKASAEASVAASLAASVAPAVGVALPPPKTTGGKPLMQALSERRTVREYDSKMLSPQTMSNLLWAAFGVNRPKEKGRTAPSAHDVQEISIYVVTEKGVSLYDPFANRLVHVSNQDIRALTGKQDFVITASVNLVYVSDHIKLADDPEEYRRFYSATDTGFISQNVYLFCASEGLVTMVRAYIDLPALSKALGLKKNQHIILAQSVGYPKK